jgi:hypothetical protein
MSFAMAFFSIALLLNVSGVPLRDVASIELGPASVVRAYEQATGRLERYYENIRIVYEIQSRVQELRQSATEPQAAPAGGEGQPLPPTGGLAPGRGSHSGSASSASADREAWLRSLPSAQEQLTEEALSTADLRATAEFNFPGRNRL